MDRRIVAVTASSCKLPKSLNLIILAVSAGHACDNGLSYPAANAAGLDGRFSCISSVISVGYSSASIKPDNTERRTC